MRVNDAARLLRSIRAEDDGDDLEYTREPWDIDNGLLDPDAGDFDPHADYGDAYPGDDLDDLFGDEDGDDDDSEDFDDEDEDLDDLGLTEQPDLVPDLIDGAVAADPSGKIKPDWVGRAEHLENLAAEVHRHFGTVTPRELEIRKDLAAVRARGLARADSPGNRGYCPLCGDEHDNPDTTEAACLEMRPHAHPDLAQGRA